MTQRTFARPTRYWIQTGLLLLIGWLGLTCHGISAAPITAGLSQLPLADPIIEADAQIHAQKTRVWRDGGVQYLLLERDVSVGVGTYGFRAARAVLRIEREAVAGREVKHLWLYLEDAQPMRGRGPTVTEAPFLLVTVSTQGAVNLETDLFKNEDASSSALVAAARDRFEKRLQTISRKPLDVPSGQPLNNVEQLRQDRKRLARPTVVLPPKPEQSPVAITGTQALAQPTPVAVSEQALKSASQSTGNLTGAVFPVVVETSGGTSGGVSKAVDQLPGGAILPPVGTVHLTFDQMVVDLDSDQPYAVLIGKVGVMFVDRHGKLGMSLRAEQAVLFLTPDKEHEQIFSQTDAASVAGVYLEDSVIATDGSYTLRSPRVYYDNVQNKAVVLDAVMYTWDVRQKVPIYVRAEKLMQQSRQSWTAHQAQLTTSEFAEPHFSIAARTITLTHEKNRRGEMEYRYVAQKPSLRWGKTTVMRTPRLAGKAQDIPLQNINVNYSENKGANIQTRWDLFSLIGRENPSGVDMALQLDYRGIHGPGIGLNLDYDRPQMFGMLESYGLLRDTGDDKIGGRNDIEHDSDTRGYIHGQHRSYLQDDWELSLELGYVSDETFLEEFFRSEAQTAKPYETSLYLKRQQDDWAMTLLGKYEVNDFTAQTSILQYQGYTVDKLPELGLYSVGSSLWGDRLTYFGQTQASRMKIRIGDDNPQDRGFTAAQSAILFGQSQSTRFKDALTATGIPTSYVSRLDSRHELQAPLKVGTVNVVPFATGRVTAYDDDFRAFSGNDDNVRIWGSVGLRAQTEFHRTFNSVESRLWNLHQLRHVIEPHVTFSLAGSTLDAADLPVFDQDIEAIRDGMTVKVGARNTFQTKRGGPGRWRIVDWIVLDTDVVVSSGEVNNNPNALGNFFDYRPEFSRGGDYFHSNVAWMVSDALAAVGEMTYDFEANKTSQWRAGISLQHAPQLTSFVDYSEIDTLGSSLLTYGFTYQLTRKYSMALSHRMDLSQNNQRFVDVTLIRELPRWRLIMEYSLNEIDGDQSVALLLMPLGFGGSRYTRPIYHDVMQQVD